MYLTHLSLTNFRAFTRLDIEIPRRILLLVGDNAQGKTTILESIYYLATFNSFHAQTDRQLISFLVDQSQLVVARLVADYIRGTSSQRLEVRLIQEPSGNGGFRLRKEILVDGVKRNHHEALRHFTAVIFLPQMTRILEGGPEERRRYLNLVISQAVPGYSHALSEYAHALTQRNALLKQLGERGGDPAQLEFWDELLARRGAFLILARIQAIQEIEREAIQIFQGLTHSEEMLRLVYQPAFDPLPENEKQYALPLQTPVERGNFTMEQIQQGFLQKLASIRSEEIARGVTTVGPHRDELRFLSNGIDLGDYGSRGQVRTTLLALKLAEVAWLKSQNDDWPVLLLDEMLAELDTQRRADLLDYLGTCEQALLTTTDLKLFKSEFINQSTVWKVQRGKIST